MFGREADFEEGRPLLSRAAAGLLGDGESISHIAVGPAIVGSCVQAVPDAMLPSLVGGSKFGENDRKVELMTCHTRGRGGERQRKRRGPGMGLGEPLVSSPLTLEPASLLSRRCRTRVMVTAEYSYEGM
jgi:hypothetical protein